MQSRAVILALLLLGDFNQLPDTQLKSFPLQQIVTSATRGTSVLDKIYNDVSSWYQTPVILPAVSRSDHETIWLQPTINPLKGSGNLFAGDNVLTPKGYRIRYCHVIIKNTDCPTLDTVSYTHLTLPTNREV